MTMTFNEIATYRNKINALRRSKYHKSAAKLSKELQQKITNTGTDLDYVAYVIGGIGADQNILDTFLGE